jgi:hypothetical protein
VSSQRIGATDGATPNGSKATTADGASHGRGVWTPAYIAGFVGLVILGLLLRLALWPQPGLAGDLDGFVVWVHGIATDGWDHAYDQNLSFPAVMAWIWGALAAIQPQFAVARDASDPAIRELMKMPASLCDLGIAFAVAWWFRDRPRLALIGAAAILLWPVTWYVSAWWGQYESIYVLPALLALLAARAGRPNLTAALLAISLMTKPQALPFVVPFAAWFLATQGWRVSLRAAAIGAAVVLVVWLPFVPAGGPVAYLHNLSSYENDLFSVLSLRAWNPWWLVQELFARGDFVSDQTSLAGPVTFRLLGLAITALIAAVVFLGVYRRPSPERLAMGLAAISLGAFVALTTMHERYAYPAFVFVMLCWPRRQVVAAWVVLAVAIALNLVYAIPPPDVTPPADGLVSVAGAIAMTVVAFVAIGWTAGRGSEATPTGG